MALKFVSSKVLRIKEHHFVTSPFMVVYLIAMFPVIADVMQFRGI